MWVGDFGEDDGDDAYDDDGEDECVHCLECEAVSHMRFFGWFVFKWWLVWVIIFIYLLLFSGG